MTETKGNILIDIAVVIASIAVFTAILLPAVALHP
jgi:hypothetical protein